MAIRAVRETDFPQLISLYKEFFPVHTIFQQDAEEVAAYLKTQAEQHEFLVAEEGTVKGALFLVKIGEASDHILWKFRHMAFETELIARQLLQEAERRVQESSKTAKIEVTVAETEEGFDVYRKKGYEQEGKLKNHYRFGEVCFVLGKSFP